MRGSTVCLKINQQVLHLLSYIIYYIYDKSLFEVSHLSVLLSSASLQKLLAPRPGKSFDCVKIDTCSSLRLREPEQWL